MPPQFEYDADTIKRACGVDAAHYAKNKKRGGLASHGGLRFEVLYAAHRIAIEANMACSAGETAQDIWFQDQVGGFVDDLAVVAPSATTLSQVKSGTVSWTAGEHSLAEDFRLQGRLDRALCRPVSYELVVPTDDTAELMRKSRPSDLMPVAVTVFRAVGDDLQGLFRRQPELATALDGISLRPPQDIVREQTFEAILGAWVYSRGQGFLTQILRNLAARPDALVRVPGPNYELRADVAEALQSVRGFTWTTEGMHFRYGVGGRLSGWAAFLCDSESFRAFEDFLLESRPTRWTEVVSALRKEG